MPKKDPNKPKGAASAYAFFLQGKRKEAKKAGKKVDFTEFSQECSAEWRDMDDDDKKQYQELAKDDKKRYQKEMESYVPPDDADDPKPKGKKRGKQKKDKNAPKRAMSGFMFFCSDQRPVYKAQNQGASIGELAKVLGAAWNELSTEDRQPYDDQAKKDQKRYKEQKEAYDRGEFNKDDGDAIDDESDEE